MENKGDVPWWKDSRMFVIALSIVLVVTLIGGLSYRGYRTYADLKFVVEQQKEQIKGYQDQISQNNAELEKSEKNRKYLATQIAKKIAEAKNIKEPKDVEEIKQRLMQLGFHPIAGKR